MIDPISLTAIIMATISALGTIILAIIQIFETHDIKSSCCVFGQNVTVD